MARSRSPSAIFDRTKPFVHVFDETSVDLVMAELDTIDDFVRYLEAKEAFIRSGRLISAVGEEELLAYFLQDAVVEHPQYRAKKEADAVSYMWDAMIESVAKCVAEGRLAYGNEFPLQDHERGLRLLAAEPRVARRALARSLQDLFARSSSQELYARTMPSASAEEHGYVFMTLRRRRKYRSEERHRQFRQQTVLHYCNTVKLRRPETRLLVGLGFGAECDQDNSIDLIVRDFGDWDEEDARDADEIRQRYGWSMGEGLVERRGTEHEYPDIPVTSGAPRTGSMKEAGKPRDSDERSKRKAHKKARRKNRR